jgi:uncharacterized protein YndB with AHSA1/START domain
MDATKESDRMPMQTPTTAQRVSDRELVVTRTFNAPPRIVFEAWTQAELFQKWWVPKSFGLTLLSCAIDARKGGTYRLTFQNPSGEQPLDFFGTYVEVTPHARLVWTNDEAGDAGPVTTVTFEERDGKTLLVLRDLYPSKEALDEGAGSLDAVGETFDQLDAVLAARV